MPQKTKHDTRRTLAAEPAAGAVAGSKKPSSEATAPEAMMSPTITDYGAIQRDEVEVLQSIFVDEFEKIEKKPGAWKVCQSGESSDPEFDSYTEVVR